MRTSNSRELIIGFPDAWYVAASVLAVFLFGVSKGGFGGAFGIVSVPLMSLVMSPVQAAAVLLPILCLIDLIGLWSFRGRWDRSEIKLLLPAAILGITIGALTFQFFSQALIRLLLGVVALGFTFHYLTRRDRPTPEAAKRAPVLATAAGTIAGFVSFVAHAGGPPLNMYLLRRHLDRTTFVATSVMFFAMVNYAKLVPYALLGQFDTTNLRASLMLAPVGALGFWAGVQLHHRLNEALFFRLMYGLLFVVGIKLVYDGAVGLRYVLQS